MPKEGVNRMRIRGLISQEQLYALQEQKRKRLELSKQIRKRNQNPTNSKLQRLRAQVETTERKVSKLQDKLTDVHVINTKIQETKDILKKLKKTTNNQEYQQTLKEYEIKVNQLSQQDKTFAQINPQKLGLTNKTQEEKDKAINRAESFLNQVQNRYTIKQREYEKELEKSTLGMENLAASRSEIKDIDIAKKLLKKLSQQTLNSFKNPAALHNNLQFKNITNLLIE